MERHIIAHGFVQTEVTTKKIRMESILRTIATITHGYSSMENTITSMIRRQTMYRSNCLIEAVKSKIKGGKNVRIIVCFPHRGEGMIPHCLWTDKRKRGVVYDF